MSNLIVAKNFTEFMNDSVIREVETYSREFGFRTCKRLVMNDGTEMSIQASSSHYCEPRETTEIPNYAWYKSFEVGFPSREIEDLMEYAEQPEYPTDTVYGYVPKSVIEKVINDCGGIAHAITVGEVV